MKDRCFLLSAKGLTKSKDGRPLDLGIYRLAVRDVFGWNCAEFMFGTAQTAEQFLQRLSKSAKPLECECELIPRVDNNGKMTMSLVDLSVVGLAQVAAK